MANTFISLPAPAANGAGAWTDVSAMGAVKTVTVVGNASVFEPFVTIQCSNEDTPTLDGFPLETFFMPGESTFSVAAMWMRAVVSNYRGGGAPTCSVGGTSDGTTTVELVATAGNGQGAAVDTSAELQFKTVQVAGDFRGQINILVSEDGGTTYSESFSFQSPGAQSLVITADHMKVERVGVPGVAPGLPLIWVASTSAGGGGGGGGTGDSVQTARYTATGSEDVAGFPIVFSALTPPLTVTTTDYNAWATGGGVADVESYSCPATDFTTNGLTVVPTGALTAGDVIIITVSEHTGTGGGGGGGVAGVAVQEDGVGVVSPATILNFTGSGVSVSGSGVTAVIDIPGGGGGGGVNVLDADSTVVAAASGIRFLGAPVTVAVDGVDPTIADVTVTVPAASSFTVTLPADVGSGFQPGQVGYQDPVLSHRFTPSGNNDTEKDAQVLGMCTQAQVGSTQVVCVAGPVTLTAPQWAAVIAEGGPLVEGIYYLADYNASLAGSITAIKPTASGSYLTVVGYAIRLNGVGSTLTFVVRPEAAILIP